WAGTLSGIFVIVEVVMNDLSLPQWIDQQAATSREAMAVSDAELARLAQETPPNAPAIAAARLDQKVHSRRVARFEWWSPLAHKWLPTTPFTTLLVVCGGVLMGTLVKNVFRVINAMVVARLGCRVGLEMRKVLY